MEHAYAEALMEMIGKGAKPHEAVAALNRSLTERGRTGLLPKIARAFERLAQKDAARTTMTLSVAHAKDARAALKEAQHILALEKMGDTELCEVVDDSLIGGWRLEGRGVLVDASWKEDLLSMYNRATQ